MYSDISSTITTRCLDTYGPDIPQVLAMKACLPFPKLGVNGCHGDGFGTPLYDDLDAAGDTGLPWQRMSYGVGVARRPPSAQSIVLSAEYELVIPCGLDTFLTPIASNHHFL